MENQLEGKVAIVTGGTRGIGRAVAQALLAGGASVFLCARDRGGVDRALAELRAPAGRLDGTSADVGRYDDCRRVVAATVERFRALDILVNNAGVGSFKPVDQITPEEWDATIRTNLSGPFYMSREVVPHLRRRGGGYIFNVSSLAGINAFAGGAAYNASKFGLNGFSEAMMQDLRYDGIRVSYIMPGSVATDFGGRGTSRMGPQDAWKLTPEDIAKAVVDLYRFPPSSLASRIELRPSQPPRK